MARGGNSAEHILYGGTPAPSPQKRAALRRLAGLDSLLRDVGVESVVMRYSGSRGEVSGLAVTQLGLTDGQVLGLDEFLRNDELREPLADELRDFVLRALNERRPGWNTGDHGADGLVEIDVAAGRADFRHLANFPIEMPCAVSADSDEYESVFEMLSELQATSVAIEYEGADGRGKVNRVSIRQAATSWPATATRRATRT